MPKRPERVKKNFVIDVWRSERRLKRSEERKIEKTPPDFSLRVKLFNGWQARIWAVLELTKLDCPEHLHFTVREEL